MFEARQVDGSKTKNIFGDFGSGIFLNKQVEDRKKAGYGCDKCKCLKHLSPTALSKSMHLITQVKFEVNENASRETSVF